MSFREMEKLKSVFTGTSSGAESDLSPITEIAGGENSSMCPSMGFKDRMIAFGVCTGIGFMLSIGGSINLFFLNYSGEFSLSQALITSFNFNCSVRCSLFARNNMFAYWHRVSPWSTKTTERKNE